MLALWNAFPAVDRIFDDVMGTAFSGFGSATQYTPSVDLRWNDKEVIVSLDVPGVKREDIEVTLQNRELTVKGSRKLQTSKNEEVKVGRAYGSFSVSYALGDEMNGEELSADLADGVLTIRIPKLAKVQPRRIEVHAHNGKKELDK